MNQPITITFVPEQIFTWLIIGLIAGLLASILVRGRRFGLWGSIVVGLLGALIGGFLFTVLRIQVPPALADGFTIRYIDIIVAFIGALIVLLLFGAVWWRRS
ncbi:MAG TPA: GlsB/YeaQ/YmgE family stress response membrane protein [Phototrophicaceae bacterium]|nr:GlsB/YeaQ/YmgE family stress response membrane protein [Phototrophicaceae bacterium]